MEKTRKEVKLLSLNKETLRLLGEPDLRQAKGGDWSDLSTCYQTKVTCCYMQ